MTHPCDNQGRGSAASLHATRAVLPAFARAADWLVSNPKHLDVALAICFCLLAAYPWIRWGA